MRVQPGWFVLLIVAASLLSACGFHLRRSAALPVAMQQQVYLQIGGDGEFARSIAAALRASGVEVLDQPRAGVATLAMPVAAFSSRLLRGTGYQRVGEYAVGFRVQFRLLDGTGYNLIPTQSLELSHEFAVDPTQFTAIASGSEAIRLSLLREMTDAVMRRLEAHADAAAPVSASSAAGPAPAPASAGSVGGVR